MVGAHFVVLLGAKMICNLQLFDFCEWLFVVCSLLNFINLSKKKTLNFYDVTQNPKWGTSRLVFFPGRILRQGAVPGNVFGGGGVGVLEQGHRQVFFSSRDIYRQSDYYFSYTWQNSAILTFLLGKSLVHRPGNTLNSPLSLWRKRSRKKDRPGPKCSFQGVYEK